MSENNSSNQFEVIQLNKIQGPDKWADAMGTDSTGRFISTHDEDTFDLEIWDLSMKINDPNFKTVKLTGHTDEVHCVKFVPSENLLLSGGADKSVRLWNLIDGMCLRILTGHEGDVWSVDLDRFRIVSGGRYGEIRIWGRGANNIERSLWLHSRATAIGRIKLEPAILITTDGMGGILFSDFWNFVNAQCGCGSSNKLMAS
jgi:WD40 repeat protein